MAPKPQRVSWAERLHGESMWPADGPALTAAVQMKDGVSLKERERWKVGPQKEKSNTQVAN